MDRYEISGAEPALSEVLDDPIVRLLMARDNVCPRNLEQMIERVRAKRAALANARSLINGRRKRAGVSALSPCWCGDMKANMGEVTVTGLS